DGGRSDNARLKRPSRRLLLDALVDLADREHRMEASGRLGDKPGKKLSGAGADFHALEKSQAFGRSFFAENVSGRCLTALFPGSGAGRAGKDSRSVRNAGELSVTDILSDGHDRAVNGSELKHSLRR